MKENKIELLYKRDTGKSSRIGYECTRYKMYVLNIAIDITDTFDDSEGVIEFHRPEYVQWLESKIEELSNK